MEIRGLSTNEIDNLLILKQICNFVDQILHFGSFLDYSASDQPEQVLIDCRKSGFELHEFCYAEIVLFLIRSFQPACSL